MRRALHIRIWHVQNSVLSIWYIPETRRPSWLQHLTVRMILTQVDKSPIQKLLNSKRFITIHNEELQGRSSNVITDPVFVHISVRPAPEYGLLSPWSQYGYSHSRHYIHHTNIQRWVKKSGSSLYFFLRTKEPFPEDSTTTNSHWSDLHQIPMQKPVTDERNSPALCDSQRSGCVMRSGFW